MKDATGTLFADALQKRAAELRALAPGWDGEGGDPPDEKTLVKAVALALAVAPMFPTYEPALVPCSDGTLMVEWHDEGYDVEMWVHHAV